MARFSVVGIVRRLRRGKLGNFEIQVAMVPGGEHLALDHILEPFQIDDKAGDRVGSPATVTSSV